MFIEPNLKSEKRGLDRSDLRQYVQWQNGRIDTPFKTS